MISDAPPPEWRMRKTRFESRRPARIFPTSKPPAPTAPLRVAGVDEAGRGPLAGPVVVAAVVFAEGRFPEGLNDSKKLTAKRREALFAEILALGEVAIVAAPPAVIDTAQHSRRDALGHAPGGARPADAGPISP